MTNRTDSSNVFLRACLNWAHCLAVCGLLTSLTLAVPARAQDSDAEKKAEAFYDLLGTVYPNASGARALFNRLEIDPAARAELARIIQENPDLAARAAEGLEYRQDYVKRVTGEMNGEGPKIIIAPVDAALDSLRNFTSAHFEMNWRPPPDWKILRDSWEETLNRFGLDRGLTPNDLEKRRRESEVYERAHEFFTTLKQRMEYRENLEVIETTRTDVQVWRRYFKQQIQFTRENNLQQALAMAAVYSKAKFRTDVLGREETKATYSKFREFFTFLSDSLRAHLRPEDFARAKVYLIPNDETLSAEEYPEQGIFPQRGRSPYNIVRSISRTFFTVNWAFNMWYRKLPSAVMKTSERPLRLKTGSTPYTGFDDYMVVAFDLHTLTPQAKKLMAPSGGMLRFKVSEFNRNVLEELLTDSVLHYQSSHAKEKRFVAEAALRDLQMSDLQRLIQEDESKEARPLISKLEERKANVKKSTMNPEFPATLMDEARFEAKLGDEQKNDAVTGLKWWGQSIFPAYWMVRDAVATKHKRPDIDDVVKGKAELKRDGLPKPFSRLASHFRYGSKAKRALITVGVLGLLYSTPLWIEPAQNFVGSQLSKIAEKIERGDFSGRPGSSSSAKSEAEAEDKGKSGGKGQSNGGSKGGGNSEGNENDKKSANEKPENEGDGTKQATSGVPQIKKYEKPYIVPKKNGAGGGDDILFFLKPGATGVKPHPYFFSYADGIESQQTGFIQTRFRTLYGKSIDLNDRHSEMFDLKRAEEVRADYYVESNFVYPAHKDPYNIQKFLPVPLVHNHEIVSFEYQYDGNSFWINGSNDGRFFRANGYGFREVGWFSRPYRVRIGYRAVAAPPTPEIDKALKPAALAHTVAGLRDAGFTKLSGAVDQLIAAKAGTVTFGDLESTFSNNTTYTYRTVGKESERMSTPYSHMTQFQTHGEFHAQCTGSFEMFRTFGDQYRINAAETKFTIMPYGGFAVDPIDPMTITSGGGHIVARFVQTADGASAVFDATGADPSGGSSSKASNPWKGPPKPTHPADRPWNLRRRELWLGLAADAKFALRSLKKINANQDAFDASRKSIEHNLEEMRTAIVNAKLNDEEFKQSPLAPLMEVLPDLVAYRMGELTEAQTIERLQRKLSLFLSFDLKNATIKSVLNNYYGNSSKYFTKLKDWADNEPERIMGLEGLLDDKVQSTALAVASALYYGNWKAPFYKMPRRSCEDLLIQNDTEQWLFWDEEIRRTK